MTSGLLDRADRTPVVLTIAGARDVAVISGVVQDPSVIFLCRSIINGDAFARYPALVIDLRKLGLLSAEAQHELAVARQICLSRHQWLGVVRPGESASVAIVRARRWRRLVDGPTNRLRLRLYAASGLVRGLIGLMPAVWAKSSFQSAPGTTPSGLPLTLTTRKETP